VTLSLEHIKKLHQKKYRQEFGYFLVEGEHLVLELHNAILHKPELSQSQLLVSGLRRLAQPAHQKSCQRQANGAAGRHQNAAGNFGRSATPEYAHTQ